MSILYTIYTRQNGDYHFAVNTQYCSVVQIVVQTNFGLIRQNRYHVDTIQQVWNYSLKYILKGKHFKLCYIH